MTRQAFLTLTALLVTETSRFRATTWKEYWKMILSAFLDNLGWHQIRVISSFWATIPYVLLRRSDLGAQMVRSEHPSSVNP